MTTTRTVSNGWKKFFVVLAKVTIVVLAALFLLSCVVCGVRRLLSEDKIVFVQTAPAVQPSQAVVATVVPEKVVVPMVNNTTPDRPLISNDRGPAPVKPDIAQTGIKLSELRIAQLPVITPQGDRVVMTIVDNRGCAIAADWTHVPPIKLDSSQSLVIEKFRVNGVFRDCWEVVDVR